MSVLRKPSIMDSIQTNGVPITRRSWWARLWCVHAQEDRLYYTRIDHRAGPGFMANNYEGSVCRACGYVHWERRLVDWPPAPGAVVRQMAYDIANLPMRVQGFMPPRVRFYDELPGGMGERPGFLKSATDIIRERPRYEPQDEEGSQP